MGYYTTFDGRIEIDPPLTWEEIRETPWADAEGFPELRIEVEEETVTTEVGEATLKKGVAVVPAQEDPYKGYSILSTLKEILAAFPDHAFSGEIRAEGEEAGDIWRMRIVNGKAIREDAQVTWPDGTKAGAR